MGTASIIKRNYGNREYHQTELWEPRYTIVTIVVIAVMTAYLKTINFISISTVVVVAVMTAYLKTIKLISFQFQFQLLLLLLLIQHI